MVLVRLLTVRCLEYNIALQAIHIPGSRIEICDALSRLQFGRFRRRVKVRKNAQPPLERLRRRIPKLLTSSLAINTNLTYGVALAAFAKFRNQYKLLFQWPVPPKHKLVFISYCFEQGYAATTIKTNING